LPRKPFEVLGEFEESKEFEVANNEKRTHSPLFEKKDTPRVPWSHANNCYMD
jgi:hypothetical protein